MCADRHGVKSMIGRIICAGPHQPVTMADKIFGLDDVWAIAQATDGDHPLIIRFRTGLERLIGDQRLPNRLTIAWAFEPAPERSGLPDPALSDAMTAFEDLLSAALEPAELAVLTSVWTTNGTREWVWYGGEGERLVDAINSALAGHERLPIELMIEADPAWEQYKDLLASAE
jgi:hypothetical protein